MSGDSSIYTVYRAGDDRPLRRVRRGPGPGAGATREAAVVAPPPLAALSRRRRRDRRSGRTRGLLLTVLGVAGPVAVLTFLWLFARQPLHDLGSVLGLAKATGWVPTWLLYGMPAAVAGVAAVVTAYLAFGHRRVLKAAGLAVVTVMLAAPGFALGWTNGTLGEMGDRTAAVAARVEHARKKLKPPLPGKAVNILLLGTDTTPDDPGRSDTVLLARLDPVTKSITMLSFPRDLYVEIPGYGHDKINAAYHHGGAALSVETVGHLTGLPIHHFIEVDFGGFWRVVNILGGVYYPVDRRYYNPESSSWKSIDLEPGYQLLRGKDALDFVRFRHDARGDFSRMDRQQTFLKELQRQSGRWNKDWKKVTRLLRAITAQVTSDLDSLQQLLPLASLALTLDTTNVHKVHITGGIQAMGDASYVVASAEEIKAAVAEFSNPTQPPVVRRGGALPKKAYEVRVMNGGGVPGMAASVAGQLRAQGYHARAVGNAEPFTYEASMVYAARGMTRTADQFVRLLAPAGLRFLPRVPGGHDGITVVVGSSFDGTIVVPEPEAVTEAGVVATEGRYDETGWRALDEKVPMRLQMPGVWSPGFVYDEFRAYRVPTPSGRQAAAAVAVARTPQGGYFSIQAMRWLTPPAIANPTAEKKIGTTTYLLFYNGRDLHMVAWRRGNVLYWVLNTLDDELPPAFMMELATSFAPVGAAGAGSAAQAVTSASPESASPP